jgi:hypothetical protein
VVIVPESSHDIVTLLEGGIRPVSADEARSVAAQASSPRHGRCRRARVVVPIAVLAAAAVLAFLLVPSATPGGPGLAAAAELHQLAVRAANVNVASLAPGQYIYSDIERPTAQNGVAFTPGGPSVSEYLYGHQQTWVNAQGYGRMVVTTDPTPHFFSKTDEQAWKAAGSPPALLLPNEQSQVVTVTPTGAGPLAATPLFQAANLPTDPTALEKVLAAGQFKEYLAFTTPCQSTDCTVVESATALLEGPDVGATSSLRSALFDILSHVSGVTNLGPVTNVHGASGIGLSYVQHFAAHQGTSVCAAGTTPENPTSSPSLPYDVPAHTVTYTFVVDPLTTAVTGTEEVTSPDVQTTPPDPCPGATMSSHEAFVAPKWTSVQSEGVVASETSTSPLANP